MSSRLPGGAGGPGTSPRGRRTVEERQRAVLELMAGKTTVDQIARRLGVHAATVEGARTRSSASSRRSAVAAASPPPEFELERKHRDLEKVVTTLSIQKCLLEQALEVERKAPLPGPRGPSDEPPDRRG